MAAPLSTEEEGREIVEQARIQTAAFAPIIVANEAQYALAAKAMVDLKRVRNGIVDKFKPPKQAAHLAHSRICELEKSVLDEVDAKLEAIKQPYIAFEKQETTRREEEAKRLHAIAEAEARQAAEDARIKMEADQAARNAVEAKNREAAEAQAREAYKAGERTRAKEIRAQQERDEIEAAARAEMERQELEAKAEAAKFVAPIEVAKLVRPTGVSVRKPEWGWRLKDIEYVEDAFKGMLNEKLIDATVKAQGKLAERTIGGIEVFEKPPTLQVRAGK